MELRRWPVQICTTGQAGWEWGYCHNWLMCSCSHAVLVNWKWWEY